MKILLASKYGAHGAVPKGGVQSWNRTVRHELVRRGHWVAQWERGQPVPQEYFDLGIFAHWRYSHIAAGMCERVINVCHGPIDDERPKHECAVFTSEEVREHWGGSGPVIRQPIDTEFWHPGTHDRHLLTRFSYRGGLGFVPEVAVSLGLEYQHVRNSTPSECKRIMRRSACVLATGRAALEAMACGAPVVICDHREPYQGPLMDFDTAGAMKRNYSGRGGVVPTLENVAGAVRQAMGEGHMRSHVMTHHDVPTVVDQLCSIS